MATVVPLQLSGSSNWPWPRDTHEDRLRRIIAIYRETLMDVNPVKCAAVDSRMNAYGQGWITSELIVDKERLVTVSEVAAEFDIHAHNVHDWARRHPDLIPKRGVKGRSTLFRLGDILAYQALKGGRK